jgi:hypothetical protein
MVLSRLGSLNALEQLKDSKKLRKFLGDCLPSADTLGRVFALMDTDAIRKVQRGIYYIIVSRETKHLRHRSMD